MNKKWTVAVGNIGNLLTLIGTAGFAYMVATAYDTPFFDEDWKENGFCVTNQDVTYWSSHDVCLYFDTLAGLVLLAAYGKLHATPGLEAANEVAIAFGIGTLCHGIGHGSVAHGMRVHPNRSPHADRLRLLDMLRLKPWAQIALSLLPLLVFWPGVLKASVPNIRNGSFYVLATLAALGGQLFVPGVFGFTYVQTTLGIASSLNQLLRPIGEKDEFYAVMPFFVTIPVTLAGWMESMYCTAFVKQYLYGHLMYDACIPTTVLAWYLYCYNLTAAKAKAA